VSAQDSAKTTEKAECKCHPSEAREQHEGPPALVVAAMESRGSSSGRAPTGGGHEPTRDEELDALVALYVASNPEVVVSWVEQILRRAGRLK